MAAVDRVGRSGWYVLGDEVRTFERQLSELMARDHAVGCASGLDAIEISLRALGLRPGDEVLTTPFSAFATTLAILRAGGVPVFVDVDETGLVDLKLAAQCIESHPTIRYFVPVHLFGQSLDLNALQALKEKHDLAIVEDCAQAIGARSNGRATGCIGEAATLSFYPTKNLGALGDGGAMVFDDAGLAETARTLRDYGQAGKYVHDRLGLNSRLDELHAAILRTAFLPRLAQWTERRTQIAQRYLEGLSNPAVVPLPTPAGSEAVWHLFPVQTSGGGRDDLCDWLRKADVQASVHYPHLIPHQKGLEEAAQGYRVFGSLETAERLSKEEVSLPIHPYLEDAEIDRVIELVNRWRGS